MIADQAQAANIRARRASNELDGTFRVLRRFASGPTSS